MKHFINESKKRILAKLKYLSSLLEIVANIAKSFTAIIASLVAGTVAGVTGYYEVKKVVKRERHSKNELSSGATRGPAMAGEGHGSGMGAGRAMTAAPSSPEQAGYSFDMNSGAFLVSIVMLGVMLFNKLKKPKV